MAVAKIEYDAGTAAALKWLQDEIEQNVPDIFRGMIPVDREPEFAAAIAKVVLDAADKV